MYKFDDSKDIGGFRGQISNTSQPDRGTCLLGQWETQPVIKSNKIRKYKSQYLNKTRTLKPSDEKHSPTYMGIV